MPSQIRVCGALDCGAPRAAVFCVPSCRSSHPLCRPVAAHVTGYRGTGGTHQGASTGRNVPGRDRLDRGSGGGPVADSAGSSPLSAASAPRTPCHPEPAKPPSPSLTHADSRAKISREPGTASPSLSLEDTSPPWSAGAARPECGHCWQRPKDSEPPGHGAHPGPMCRAAENHSRNPS